MAYDNLKAWWYESFPIELLSPFDIPESKTNGVKTGGMKEKEWIPLINSLKEEGMVNPIIVEDNNSEFKVAIGNNRVWAMKSFGDTTIKAIVITRGRTNIPPGGIHIPKNIFVHQMKLLHPKDETWRKSAFATKIACSALQIEGDLA